MSFKLQDNQHQGNQYGVNHPGVLDRESNAGDLAAMTKGSADQQDTAAPKRQSTPTSQPTIAQTIEYILAFTTELKFMAQQAGLSRLALILMLAEQESHQQLERHPNS
jgi:hypothetical protein